MKYIITVIFVLFFIPTVLLADITSLPWGTTYNCDDWDNADDLICDDMSNGGGAPTAEGNFEQINSTGNYSGGGGFSGQIHWLGDGQSGDNSGGVNLDLALAAPQKELWIRWYMEFQSGFSWIVTDGNLPQFYKMILLHSTGDQKRQITLTQNEVSLAGGTFVKTSTGGKGWLNINGDYPGDGEFHYYEIHIKMDTDGSNGEFDMWVEDSNGNIELALSSNSADYGNHTGFDQIGVGSNGEEGDNKEDYTIKYDDIFISNTGRIGPISAETQSSTVGSGDSSTFSAGDSTVIN